jgi:RimJ/RimL family protein N-acetyltransferase
VSALLKTDGLKIMVKILNKHLICLTSLFVVSTALLAMEGATNTVNPIFEGIETKRLFLRSWLEKDISIIHSIMEDPKVNYYLQNHKLDQLQNIQLLANKSRKSISELGYGYFVCEYGETGEVIGMFGLNYVEIADENFPCYTVSWILKKNSWGKGFHLKPHKL